MLDAPIVRLILAYHLTCSRWKCSWGEGTHWKASGTYVKSKNIPLQTELSWAIWFRDNPGLVHWCSATSTDGMSHHPAAPRPPSLLQHVQHLGLEDRVYSLAQKCQWPPWHWNLVVIYIYIERSVEMAKPDMPGCHAWFFCLNRIPKWTPELINGVGFHAPVWDSPVTVPQHWHYCLTEAWRTRPLHGPRKAAAIFRSGSTWVITYKELGTVNYATLI